MIFSQRDFRCLIKNDLKTNNLDGMSLKKMILLRLQVQPKLIANFFFISQFILKLTNKSEDQGRDTLQLFRTRPGSKFLSFLIIGNYIIIYEDNETDSIYSIT